MHAHDASPWAPGRLAPTSAVAGHTAAALAHKGRSKVARAGCCEHGPQRVPSLGEVQTPQNTELRTHRTRDPAALHAWRTRAPQ